MRTLIIGVATVASLATAGSALAASPTATHWCRAGDPPLHASAQTPCSLAAGLVNVLFNGPALSPGSERAMSVRSPVTHRLYRLQLSRRSDQVTATGPNGVWICFYYDG